MTLFDYLTRNLPPYHDTMFVEGYKPWEIWTAGKQLILDAPEPTEIIITGRINPNDDR